MVTTRRIKAASAVGDDDQAEKDMHKKSNKSDPSYDEDKHDTALDDETEYQTKENSEVEEEDNKEITAADAAVTEEPTDSAAASNNKPQDDSSSSANKENPETAVTYSKSVIGGEMKPGTEEREERTQPEEGNQVVPPEAAAAETVPAVHPFYPPPPHGSHYPYYPMQSWGAGPGVPPPPPFAYPPHLYYPPYYPTHPSTEGPPPPPQGYPLPHPHYPPSFPQHLMQLPGGPPHFSASASPSNKARKNEENVENDAADDDMDMGEDDDDESKEPTAVNVKTYVKSAKARNPTVLIRRQRKNQDSRRRANTSKKRMAEIAAKPCHERTEEEDYLFETFENRRSKKNERSKERAKEKKETMDLILSKPAHKRSKVEINFLEQNMSAKQRKNEGDRLRRDRLKQLGLDRQSGGGPKPGVSARGPLPKEYAARLGSAGSTDGSNSNISSGDAQAYHHPPHAGAPYPTDSPFGGNRFPPHPFGSWESHASLPPPPLPTPLDTNIGLTASPPPFSPPTPHAV